MSMIGVLRDRWVAQHASLRRSTLFGQGLIQVAVADGYQQALA